MGLESPDDAAVFRISDTLALVQTVDFFTPILDDPFDWGRVAAANALSDVYAMGASPRTALNLVGWPRKLGFEILQRVLEGGASVCSEAGVEIVGGHSIDDPEPKYGMAVTGFVDPERIIRKTTARPPCDLVLTKPLGTGIICSGIKEGLVDADLIGLVTATMAALNDRAAEAMVEVRALAASDVTGFGLIGHLLEMLGTELSARLSFRDVPVLPGARELLERGVFPGGSRRNLEVTRERVRLEAVVEERESWILYDAQTSGGLLVAVAPEKTKALIDLLRRAGVVASAIGSVRRGDGTIEVTA